MELKHFRAFQVLLTHSTYPLAWWQFVAVFFVNIIISWQIGRKPLSSATVCLIHSSWLLKQWRNRKTLPVFPVWNVFLPFRGSAASGEIWKSAAAVFLAYKTISLYYSLLILFANLPLFIWHPPIFNKRSEQLQNRFKQFLVCFTKLLKKKKSPVTLYIAVRNLESGSANKRPTMKAGGSEFGSHVPTKRGAWLLGRVTWVQDLWSSLTNSISKHKVGESYRRHSCQRLASTYTGMGSCMHTGLAGLCEFKTSLVYVMSSRPAKAK